MCLCRACAWPCKCVGECARWRVRACRGRRLMRACRARAVGCLCTRRARLTLWREPEGTSAAASGNQLTMIFLFTGIFFPVSSKVLPRINYRVTTRHSAQETYCRSVGQSNSKTKFFRAQWVQPRCNSTAGPRCCPGSCHRPSWMPVDRRPEAWYLVQRLYLRWLEIA